MRPANLPTATYRLQFNADFTFADAARLSGYLHALGVSHAYASSYVKAVPGSTHGYDVVDPTAFNPEIGDEQTFAAWVDSLRAHGMGHILDLVPNHMGIARSANAWWQDVLENGPSSRYAEVFDIDWHPLKPELEQKVLLPVLGDTYGAVLERQEIRLIYEQGAFTAQYFEHVLPIAPRTYANLLSFRQEELLDEIGAETDDAIELLSILTALRHLPAGDVDEPDLRAERDREKEVIKRRLAALTARAPGILAHVERAVTAFNGRPGDPASFDLLDDLLNRQRYRLSYWRVAAEEINYRRFFDINELAAIRMEDPAVFDRTHALVFDLLARGLLDGLRIDHVDGLYDPGGYLEWVQERARAACPGAISRDRPFYVVVEKILGRDEVLPAWPVAGTSGYDFLAMVNGLFVDGQNERAISDIYHRFARLELAFREIVYRGKQLILRVSMPSELHVLAHRVDRFSERSRHYRDFTLNSLTQAMGEIIACFPVYRTYVNAREAPSRSDRAFIESAVDEARHRNPDRPAAAYDFVRDLLLKQADYLPEREHDEHLGFIGKFQQLTSPVTAKGVEDTALYIYNRLVSLNDVGCQPDQFGTTPATLHAWLAGRAPHSLSATSTHDTKRSEDVRARISVLSDMPREWKSAVARWARANRRGRSIVDGLSCPSRNEEYLLYQTLLGTWPVQPQSVDGEAAYRDRIVAYMHKAMREAKIFTSWLNPSEPHEQAMTRFVDFVLAGDRSAFRADFSTLASRVATHGVYNSLAQLAIKIGAPGVPDFYQGTELWDFSLVDPDNRRPVDYARRQALLAEIDEAVGRDGRGAVAVRLAATPFDDRLKLWATTTMLRFRRDHQAIFESDGYQPLATGGAHGHRLFAFARTDGRRYAVIVVPRLTASFDFDWRDSWVELPAGSFEDVFTGQRFPAAAPEGSADGLPEDGGRHVRAADLFRQFPIAALSSR